MKNPLPLFLICKHTKKQAVDQEKDLSNLKIVLKSYERDLADHGNRVNREELEIKTQELDKVMAEAKDSIRTLSEKRSELMSHLDMNIKPDYIKTESRLAKMENAKDAKLEVTYACSIRLTRRADS